MLMYAYVGDRTADQARPLVTRIVEDQLPTYLLVQKDGATITALDDETYEETRARGEASGIEFRYELSNFADWWNDNIAEETRAAWTAGAPVGTFIDNGDAEAGRFCSLDDGEPVEVESDEEGEVDPDANEGSEEDAVDGEGEGEEEVV